MLTGDLIGYKVRKSCLDICQLSWGAYALTDLQELLQ